MSVSLTLSFLIWEKLTWKKVGTVLQPQRASSEYQEEEGGLLMIQDNTAELCINLVFKIPCYFGKSYY